MASYKQIKNELRLEPQSDVPLNFARAFASSKLKTPPWFVTRSQWGAKETTYTAAGLSHPIRYVVVRDRFITDICEFKGIVEKLKRRQDNDMQPYGDVLENFYVDRVGRVYEGRGWDTQDGDDYKEGINFEWGWEKQKTISVSFMGFFYSYVVSPKEKTALNKVIEMGIELGKIACDYKVYHHKNATSNLKSYVSGMKNFRALE